MFTAISPQLKVVDSSSSYEPDKELLKQKLPHPSRISEFATSTGLMTMSKDNEPHIPVTTYILVIAMIALVVGAYLYGTSVGEIQGMKNGMVEMQRIQEAETNKKILDGLKALEIKEAYKLGAGASHPPENPKETK